MSRLCPRAWQPAINDWERDNRAALVDRPPATTFADALALTVGPTARAARTAARHLRAAIRAAVAAAVAGWRTYRESINARP